MNKNKVLITGSSKGIGYELATELIKKNIEVVGIARSNNIEHKKFSFYEMDLAKSNDFKIIAKENKNINILIANAGFGIFKELEQFSQKEILELFNVNLLSHILLIKEFLPILKKQKNAKIILIGSESGLSGAKKSTIYSATKFALRGFAQSLRAENSSSNIAITIINPGMANTNFYDNLNFSHGDNVDNYITKEDLRKIIEFILSLDNNLNIDEINLSPMKKVIKFIK